MTEIYILKTFNEYKKGVYIFYEVGKFHRPLLVLQEYELQDLKKEIKKAEKKRLQCSKRA